LQSLLITAGATEQNQSVSGAQCSVYCSAFRALFLAFVLVKPVISKGYDNLFICRK